MEPSRVDDQTHRLSFARRGLCIDPGDKGRALAADGLDEWKVNEHLRSQRFSQAADGRKHAIGRRTGRKCRVLEILRPDTQDDLSTFVLSEMGSLLMDEPRLSADQLARMLSERGKSLPSERAISH